MQICFPSDTLILENERVKLRLAEMSDVQHLVHISVNEPENWKYGLEDASGEENLTRYFQKALETHASKQAFPFIIFDKNSERFAGSTRFYNISLPHRRLAIGYTWIGNEFKQTGLNAHVKYIMLAYAFESLLMERVEFMADAMNERSIKSILSLGAKQEGTLRSQAVRPNGTRRDTAVFSILKKEWLEHVKPSLLVKISL
jgi:RimJ/RimL family protein N-acetyltransferase